MVSAGSGLPPELVPSTRASPGVRLKDEAIVGKPFNVQRWRPAFGIPLEHVETSERNGFEIPLVLCTLRDGLRRMGGLHEEGIFRLAPDAALCQSACEALNANAAVVPKVRSLVRRPRPFERRAHMSPPHHPDDVESPPRYSPAPSAPKIADACVRAQGVSDVHICANLIKLWFRQLPRRILSEIPRDDINALVSDSDCMAMIRGVSDAVKGVILWLLDLMADVAEHRASNKVRDRPRCTLHRSAYAMQCLMLII